MIKSSLEFINILGIAIGIGISELSGVASDIKGSPLIDTIEASHQHHIIISVLQGTISKNVDWDNKEIRQKYKNLYESNIYSRTCCWNNIIHRCI